MKKTIKKIALAMVATALLQGTVVAQEKGSDRLLKDFEHLTLDTVPPVRSVIRQAMDTLPSSLSEFKNWNLRMRLSALLPAVGVGYNTKESTRNRKMIVEEVTRGSTVVRDNTSNTTLNDDINTEYPGFPVGTPTKTTINDKEGNTSTAKKTKTSTVSRKYPSTIDLEDGKWWLDGYTLDASWDLALLLYNNDELEVAQVSRFIATFRIDYLKEVTTLYAELVGVLESMQGRENPPLSLVIRRDTFASILDEITGGYITDFSTAQGAQGVSRLRAFSSDGGDYSMFKEEKSSRRNGKDTGLVPVIEPLPGTPEALLYGDEFGVTEEEEE